MIDALFVSGVCVKDKGLPTEVRIIDCLQEADLNQSGGCNPTCADITIGDISIFIDILFCRGWGELPIMPHCQVCSENGAK
jgi:hypothetical protein